MPIHLNLLAEAQAEAEMRRRDPVKRAIWAAGSVVGVAVIYFVVLLVFTMFQFSALRKIEGRIQSQKAKYEAAANHQKQLDEAMFKLRALEQLSATRFLWGTALNALQTAVVDNIQLMQFHSEQNNILTEETKAKRGEGGQNSSAKPAFVTQKMTIYLSAKDTSVNPGDKISDYQNVIAKAPFFGSQSNSNNLPMVKLKNLSTPSIDVETGSPAVQFSLECYFPDKIIK